MPVWLIDTSVWARTASESRVRERVAGVVEARAAATCTPVLLEVFRSARNIEDFEDLQTGFSALPRIPLTAEIEERTLEVQEALVRAGQHRGIGRTDLLVAACAEAAGAILLHCDRDYELIARVSGQAIEWAQRS